VWLLTLVAWGTEECFYDSSTLDRFWNGSALLCLPGLRVERGYER
jgi:hypothetical protein